MRRLKTVRRPPIYPKTPGHLPCSSLTHPLPLSSRRPSVSFGGFGLTSNNVFDGNAGWSPDGTQIVFNSRRDSAQDVPEANEIYVMNADGSDVRRLTTNSAIDAGPRWAPRKQGVEVSEASVIIPNASALKAMTPQEVTANVRAAVVRIETDLGSGSGFIIDPNGLVLTNNHVISDGGEITVFQEDGTGFTGIVLGRDLVRDLAVLRIEADVLPALELGDLSQVPLLSVGLVAGYPLDTQSFTVTQGQISAFPVDIGRNIVWIQTDATVNPGNSGSPLLNLQGQVIGVMTTKFVDASIEGGDPTISSVGFAISSNTVKLYLERLKAGETITQ